MNENSEERYLFANIGIPTPLSNSSKRTQFPMKTRFVIRVRAAAVLPSARVHSASNRRKTRDELARCFRGVSNEEDPLPEKFPCTRSGVSEVFDGIDT